MNYSPLISVSIPTCDRPDLLREAVRSVLANTFGDFEICISDDGTPKLGQAFIDEFNDSRIRYQIHVRAGMIPNWDAVCRMGKAPYVFKLDDDDTIEPEFLAKTVAFLEGHPDASVVYTAFSIHPGDGNKHTVVDDVFFADRNCVDGLEYVRAFLLNEGYPQNHKSSGVFRRKYAEKIGWFEYAKEDVFFSLSLAACGKVGYISKPLFNYHGRPNGNKGEKIGMTTSSYESILKNLNDFFSWPFVKDKPELAAIEPLVKSRQRFMLPLLYITKSLRRDRWATVMENWRITQKYLEIKHPYSLWILAFLLRPLPQRLFDRLQVWYARTGWIKALVNRLIS